MKIKIIAAPHGPAPKEFREAWIGCVLPVGVILFLPPFGCAHEVVEIESIRQARECYLARISPDDLPAFVVPFIPALQIVGVKNPDVARWWENFHFQRDGRVPDAEDILFFRKDACRVV